MNIKTKFNIGDKFRINKDHLQVMHVTKNDLFRIDGISIDKHGIYYRYYKFPVNKNQSWNKKWRGRQYIAEFAIKKVK